MRSVLQRIGVLEVATAEHQVKVEDLRTDVAQAQTDIKALQHLTAKVTGGAIVGSAFGGWLLSQISACT